MLKTVWIDVLTPKQALLLGTIAKRLTAIGFNVVLTTRRYDYTEAILRNLNLSFLSVGDYGEDLIQKLIKELDRAKKFVEILGDGFDLLIAYPNPGAARVAFGLGKQYIALTDSPHSEIVSRLSLPLASHVIVSSCIPRDSIEVFIYKKRCKIVQFNGVDEVEWLKDSTPDPNYVKALELEPYSYIVLRPPEVKASYYRYPQAYEVFIKIAEKILEIGLKLVYLPRYANDELAMELSAKPGVLIPPSNIGVVGHNLLYFSAAVITGGATMAREAALLGTTGISLFPEELYVDVCLRGLGLPLYRCRELGECLEILYANLREPEKFKAHAVSILKSLEKPSDALISILKEDAT